MQMIDVLTKLREIAERSPEEIGRAIAAAEAMSGRPVTEANSRVPVTPKTLAASIPPPSPYGELVPLDNKPTLGQKIGAGYDAAKTDMAKGAVNALRAAGEFVRNPGNDALADKISNYLGRPQTPPDPMQPKSRDDYYPPYYNPAADHRIPPDDPMGQVSGFDPPPLHHRPGAWDHEVDSKEYKPGMNPYGDPSEMPEKKPVPKPDEQWPDPEKKPAPNEPDDDDGEWIEEEDPAMDDMKRLAGLPNSVTEMSKEQEKYFGGNKEGKSKNKKPDSDDEDDDGENSGPPWAKKPVAEDVQITLSGSDATLAEILKLAGQIGAKTTKGNDVVTAPTPPNPTLGMPTPNAPLPALTLPGEGPMGGAGPMGGSGGMGMPSTGPIPSLASMMGDEPMSGDQGMHNEPLFGGMGDETMMDGAYDANTTPNPTTAPVNAVLPKGPSGIGSQSGVTAPVVGGASTNPFESRVTFR